MKAKHVKKAMKQAKSYLKYWKRELRLDGEEVILRWFEKDELTSAQHPSIDSSGMCRTGDKTFQTTIMLKHPDRRCADEENDFNQDYEVIVVHELLHLRNKYWKECKETDELFQEHDMLDTQLEIAIDAVAEALVRARRGIKR